MTVAKKSTPTKSAQPNKDIYKVTMTGAAFEEIPKKEKLNRVLEGIAYYAKIQSPDYSTAEKFKAALRFKLTLVPDDLALAQSYGHKIKEPTDAIPFPHIVLYTKVKDGKTPEEVKPEIIDEDNQPLTDLVGNGSRVIVKYLTYWYPQATQHGVGTYMTKIKVEELVKYESNDDPFAVKSSTEDAVENDATDDYEDDLPF